MPTSNSASEREHSPDGVSKIESGIGDSGVNPNVGTPVAAAQDGSNVIAAGRELVWDGLTGFLRRRGVTDHNEWLQDALKLKYNAIWLRATGESAWTDANLAQIAAKAGITLNELFVELASAGTEEASLVIEGLRFPCRVVVGEQLPIDHDCDIVAIRGRNGLEVIRSDEAVGLTQYKVVHYGGSSISIRRPRVAVVDDDPVVLEGAQEKLPANGCRCITFGDGPSLLEALKGTQFDAFVIDWALGDQTAEQLIPAIRRDPKHAEIPILITTGQLERGVQESDVSRVVRKYGCDWKEKPIRWKLVADDLFRDTRA